MAEQCIRLAEVAKRLGVSTRSVLGCLMLSLIHQAALGRRDTPTSKRRQFHAFADEAHRFMTDALEDMIAETRKYNVSLILAHQHLSQFGQRRSDAISSTGSTIIFNVDRKDAGHLAKGLRGLADADDLIKLNKFEAVLRCGTEVVRIKTPEYRPTPDTGNFSRLCQLRLRAKYNSVLCIVGRSSQFSDFAN